MTFVRCTAVTALLVWYTAAVLWRGAGAQLDPAPPCNVAAAQLCVDRALQSQAASGCNWYLVTPALSSCVQSASAGCTEQERVVWSNIVADYNRTLQAEGCYTPCMDQSVRMGDVQSCYATIGSVEDIIAQVASQPSITSQSPPCQALSTLRHCLITATGDCPALIDLTYDQINSVPGALSACAACGLGPFVHATTSAPLILFDTATPADTLYGTMIACGPDAGPYVIIVLGCIVIASTMAVIVTVIALAIRKRRMSSRQSILRDWRPNGHKALYMDEPQLFPLANQSSRQSAGFRPQTYADLSGILNEAAVVQ